MVAAPARDFTVLEGEDGVGIFHGAARALLADPVTTYSQFPRALKTELISPVGVRNISHEE